MAQCTAHTKAGTQCSNRAVVGTEHCRIHAPVLEENRCRRVCADGTQCVRAKRVGNDPYCALHRTIIQREREVLAERVMAILNVVGREYPHIPLDAYPRLTAQIIRTMHNDGGWDVWTYVEMVLEAWPPAVAPVVAPVGRLGALANDRQNVHTREVADISNLLLERLSAVSVPSEQDVPSEVRAAWTSQADESVYNDITTWYDRRYCSDPDAGVWIYRRALDRAWAWIKTRPDDERVELSRRMREECTDAVGMCFAGHMTRIANALSGFLEGAVVERPKGEVLQERMSVISGIPNVAERMRQAREVIAELGVDEHTAAPWLEAIA